MKNFAVLFIALLFLSGCGITGGFVQNHGGTNVNYNLNISDSKFQREVSAQSDGVSILCVIPTHDALYKEAMEKLNKEADVANSRNILVNLRTDVQQSCFILWAVTTVTVSGDVYSVRLENEKTAKTIVTGINKPVKSKKDKFEDSELRKETLKSFWQKLKDKEYDNLKKDVFNFFTDKSDALRQEGFYFLGDISLLEDNESQAVYYYKRGIETASLGYNKLIFDGLKYHLQYVSEIFPDKKENLRQVYSKATD